MFIYQQISEQSKETLLALIDNIPDAVILLEPKQSPTLSTPCDQIRMGQIGTTFYDVLYANQKTEVIFGTLDSFSLLQWRVFEKIDILNGCIQKTENSQTLQTEDFADDRCNLMESLMTFEEGSESGMFLLTNGSEERVINLRKQNAIIDEK